MPKPQHIRNRHITVAVNKEERDKLERAAAEDRRPLSTWLRLVGLIAADEPAEE